MTDFQRALLDQILTSDARVAAHRQRRRLWTSLGAGITATVAAVVAVLSLGGSPATADVIVTVRDGTIRVTLTDLQASPREVASALADAGLDASVEARPVGPSNVGAFADVGFTGPVPVTIGHQDVRGNTFRTFTLPEGWKGHLAVGLGRPAQPGEIWALASDAFAPGEALHCSGVRGRSLAESTEPLTGIAVRAVTPTNPTPVPVADLSPAERDLLIVSAEAFSLDDVVVHLGAAGTAVPEEPAC